VNVLILSLSVIFFENILHISGQEVHEAFLLLEDPQVPGFVRVGLILLAVVISPVAEELFFRGMVQNYFLKRLGGPWRAILVTGFLFMLVHAPLYSQMPALWVLGLVLGWSYYRYRTLAVPVCLHIFFNGGSMLLWWTGSGG